MGEQTFGDMSEAFEFDEDDMEYLDGPLSGWIRRRSDGAWFAYECQPIIVGKLWHWTLVPAADKGSDPARVLSEAKRASWISVTEDRRATPTSVCRLVVIDDAPAVTTHSGKTRPE